MKQKQWTLAGESSQANKFRQNIEFTALDVSYKQLQVVCFLYKIILMTIVTFLLPLDDDRKNSENNNYA